MGEGWARLLRNGLGSLTILGLIVAISVGLPAVDRVLPANRPVAGGKPYPVGGGVSVVPPPHALVDLTQTRPGSTGGTAAFLVSGVRYMILVTPYSGNLTDAAARLRSRITSTRGYQVTRGESAVSTASGLAGRQGGYTAAGRSGRYAVFVVSGLAVEVTMSGTEPELRAAQREMEASIRSITYRSPR